MKALVIGFIFFMLSFNLSFGQQKFLPMHVFYKEQFIKNSGKRSIETFFPANESQLNLHHIIRDSSKQYYDVTEWLFKKHWIQFANGEGHLNISPLADVTYGKELIDTNRNTLFRNTRGVFVEGQLGKKLAFQFIFAENQARFMQYESQYIRERGEVRVGANGYYSENGTIPGAARTKPFKVDAFDYAYSIGSFLYQVNKNIRIEAGNNGHFIGSGYRSLLLSDNSVPAPNVRLSWKFAPRWEYQILYKLNKNQYRKPLTKAVEPPYENKIFAATYLTFKPTEQVSISLFTAGNHLRADSLIQHPISGQFLIPVSGFSTDLFVGDRSRINGIAGLNVDVAFARHRVYGQLAMDRVREKYLFAGQIGTHFFDVWKTKNLNAQLELNYVPRDFYAARDPKLSYNHYNLPSAHPKGNNFFEMMYRIHYTYQRFFVQSDLILQTNQSQDPANEFTPHSIFNALDENLNFGSKTGSTFIFSGELGYRFNKKYNGMLVFGAKVRSMAYITENAVNQYFYVGFKTGLLNQYFDF